MALSWRGGPWVADTSAWARAANSAVSARWKAAAHAGDLIGCPVVTLELLYDAPDRERVEVVAGALAGLRQAPINRTVTDSAISALRELAATGSAGAHRVRIPDALVAAAAAERGFAVLHYDQHFDKLSTVLGFHSQWVADAGSIP
ncbi:MAG TPA: PIN domain-containing protein [Solirubrobacteraceae bacterium]|nr:PIN domain-containing protein [Solirubrobacteraceae bacterium]